MKPALTHRYRLLNPMFLGVFFLSLSACTGARKTAVTVPDDCCCVKPTSCLSKAIGLTEEEPRQVWLDFKSKRIYFEDKYMSPAKPVQLIVTNINTLLYNVTLGDTDTFNSSPVSGATSVLATLLTPSSLKSYSESLKGVIGKVPQWKSPSISNMFMNHRLTDRDGENLVAIREVLDDGKKCQPEECIRLLQKAQTVAMDEAAEEINREIMAANELLFGLKQLLARAEKAFPECAERYKHNADSIHKLFAEKRSDFVNLERRTKRDEALYLNEIASFEKELKDGPKSLRDGDAIVREYYKSAKSELSSALLAVGIPAEDSLHARLRQLEQVENCYRSLPLFFNKDAKKMALSITPRATGSTLPGYSTQFTMPFLAGKIYGVSTGFYVDGLRNDNSVVVTGKDTSVNYTIRQDGGNNVGIGISAQAYFGTRMKGLWLDKPNYFALTFGGGLSIEQKPKPRVMLGVAGVFGYYRRFIVSTGITAGHVSRTSDLFKDKTFSEEPKDYNRDVLSAAWYFSMSYSIFGSN